MAPPWSKIPVASVLWHDVFPAHANTLFTSVSAHVAGHVTTAKLPQYAVAPPAHVADSARAANPSTSAWRHGRLLPFSPEHATLQVPSCAQPTAMLSHVDAPVALHATLTSVRFSPDGSTVMLLHVLLPAPLHSLQ